MPSVSQFQRHLWQIATGINDTGGKIAAVANNTGANNGNNIRLLKPKSELEGKNLSMLTLLPKVSQKIIKTFLIEDFFHLPTASTTLVLYLELRISRRMFEKNLKYP